MMAISACVGHDPPRRGSQHGLSCSILDFTPPVKPNLRVSRGNRSSAWSSRRGQAERDPVSRCVFEPGCRQAASLPVIGGAGLTLHSLGTDLLNPVRIAQPGVPGRPRWRLHCGLDTRHRGRWYRTAEDSGAESSRRKSVATVASDDALLRPANSPACTGTDRPQRGSAILSNHFPLQTATTAQMPGMSRLSSAAIRRSFFSARDSSCRIRSLVTPSSEPTCSSVLGSAPCCRPNRETMMFFSR